MNQEAIKSAIRAAIKDIKSGLDRGDIVAEADVSSAVVNPLLRVLGWDVFTPREVKQQYPTFDGGKVDFALLNSAGKPYVFIEAKKVGNATNEGERQLFNYAFHSGVPIIILTDGIEWSFYIPLPEGDYDDRRFYKLDLIQHDQEDCVKVFLDFLLRDAVLSGKTLEKAQDTIKSEKTRKKVKNTLPKAWVEVFSSSKDSYLAGALKEAVASICGHTPQENDIKEFLDNEFEKIKSSAADDRDVRVKKGTDYSGTKARKKVGASGRKPPLSFAQMGIPSESRLKFDKNDDLEVEVINAQEKYVRLEGKKMHIQDATQKVLGVNRAVRPNSHWKYEGKLLEDIFNDYYKKK